ncbi:MAG TPA: S8 family serine peptidase [Actinomycetota bacterium]
MPRRSSRSLRRSQVDSNPDRTTAHPHRRRAALVSALALVALGLALVPATFATGAAAPRAAVAPRVLADTANGRVAHFLVELRSQANAAAVASTAHSWTAEGRAVFGALRATASATQPSVRAQLDAMGATYRAYWVVNAFAVVGTRAVVDAMAARPDVLRIESDDAFRVQLEQPESVHVKAARPGSVEWNIAMVNAPAMWAKGFRGQGMVYANADTGVEWTHPALKPHYRGWNGSTADHNYNWWDAIHSDISGDGTNPCGFSSQAPCDDYGHGTHTMGTGIGDDGGANQIGMAPGAKWIACHNMDENVGRPSTYIECMQFFIAPTDLQGQNPNPDLRPDAVGNSYGCPLGPPPGGETCNANSLLTAMNNVRSAGVFMSVSAGNDGPSCSTVDAPPANYDSAISIGATDSNDNIAFFSSRGPVTIDGSNRRKPDLSAPGVGVRSSYPTDTYAVLSGTSMASPHVAGAVVLLWSAMPGLRHDVDLTEQILEQSAVRKDQNETCGGIPGNQYPNNTVGYGRLDVLAAYNYAQTLVPGAPTAVSATAGNASAKVTWTAPATQPGAGVTSYTVTASPGGATTTVEGTSTQAAVTGLHNGTAYRFRVTATNELGTGPASGQSSPATPDRGDTSFVSLSDAGFTPATVTNAQGGTVEWDVSGTASHEVRDGSGMGLFDSGPIAPGSDFSYAFTAAGSYTVADGSERGRVQVPLKVNPTHGTSSTTFTITTATADATAPFVYDVQIAYCASSCTPTFGPWTSGASRQRTFDSSDPAWQGSGRYFFRARLRDTSNASSSGWSKEKSITVT